MSKPDVEFDTPRLRRLRRYMWWSIVPTLPFCAFFPAINLVLGAVSGFYNTVEIVILSLVGLAVAVEGTRLSRSLMHGLGHRDHPTIEHAAVFAVSVAAMTYAVAQEESGAIWSPLVGVLASVHVCAASPRLRWPMGIGATLLIGIATATAFSPSNPLRGYGVGLFAVSLGGSMIGIVVSMVWIWDMVLELNKARFVSAELAVAKERLRFAADLHDIQGHTLQVIALKGELAERLIGTDDDTARQQVAEVTELARTALKDTREVVQGYHRSNLTAEWDNAREILKAAGVRTTVHGNAASVPPPLQPLFGALVREGTTNILRHSRAENCELSIIVDGPRTEVVLRNDRANPSNGDAGSGIEGLRRRFVTLGGQVSTRQVEKWFELRGSAEETGRKS